MKPPYRSLALPLVLGVLAVAGCSDRTAQQDTASTPAAGASAAAQEPSSPWLGTGAIKPVYPDEAASKNMNLDYQTYQLEDGGLSVAPLPPYFERTVDVDLTDSTKSYTLTAGRADCAYKIKVIVGNGEAKLLDPKVAEKMEINSESFAGASSLQLHIALAEGADQNWSCNLHIAPNSAS
jgi:hypothetical protein